MFILFPMAVLSAEEERTNKVEFALFFKISKKKTNNLSSLLLRMEQFPLMKVFIYHIST